MRLQPDEVTTRILDDLPDGAYLTAAVVVVAYLVPGEDDDDERGPYLAWQTDGIAGRWVHLGMVEAVANDCRADLRTRDDE